MKGLHLQELAAAEKELDLPGQQAQLEAAQAELAAAEAELAALDKAAEQLGTQESQYWHEFNNFQACLATHVDDRDGMLTKVCTCCLAALPVGWRAACACAAITPVSACWRYGTGRLSCREAAAASSVQRPC